MTVLGLSDVFFPELNVLPSAAAGELHRSFGGVNGGESMSSGDKPKTLFDKIADAARVAASKLPKQAGAPEVMEKLQAFVDTRLKPMGQEIKQEIEAQLFGRIKAELRKQFLYQWLAIIVGIGIAVVAVVIAKVKEIRSRAVRAYSLRPGFRRAAG